MKQLLTNIQTQIIIRYKIVLAFIMAHLDKARTSQERPARIQAPEQSWHHLKKIRLLPCDTLADIIPPTLGSEIRCYDAMMRIGYAEQPTALLPHIKPESPYSTRKLRKVCSHVRSDIINVIQFDGEKEPYVQVLRMPEEI